MQILKKNIVAVFSIVSMMSSFAQAADCVSAGNGRFEVTVNGKTTIYSKEDLPSEYKEACEGAHSSRLGQKSDASCEMPAGKMNSGKTGSHAGSGSNSDKGTSAVEGR